jgi:hypothetical protein
LAKKLQLSGERQKSGLFLTGSGARRGGYGPLAPAKLLFLTENPRPHNG